MANHLERCLPPLCGSSRTFELFGTIIRTMTIKLDDTVFFPNLAQDLANVHRDKRVGRTTS